LRRPSIKTSESSLPANKEEEEEDEDDDETIVRWMRLEEAIWAISSNDMPCFRS